MTWMTDDVVLDMAGNRQSNGKDDVEKALRQMTDHVVQELHIDNIITHGNMGSVNGYLILKDGQTLGFCDVYNFRGFGNNSKIRFI